MQKLVVIVLAAILSSAYGTGGNNFYFSRDSLLTCFVQNRLFSHYNDQERAKEEERPVIPFRHAANPGEAFLPIESGFVCPGRPGVFSASLIRRLIDFVGDELNTQLTFVGDAPPTTPAPVARDLIPLRIDTSSGTGGVGQSPEAERDYEDMIEDILDELENGNVFPTPPPVENQRQLIRNIVQFLATDRCRVSAIWQRLPFGYFPQFYAASVCSGENCSIPRGLTCEARLSDQTLLYITVLRWDCCWSLRNDQWRWECGWRKVRIPIIAQCHCGCGTQYVGDGFRYTGRIGGPFTFSVDNLNT